MQDKIGPELRARAVCLVRDHQQEYASPNERGRCEAGGGAESVRRGVAQADVDAGTRPGTTTEEEEDEEIKRYEDRESTAARGCGRAEGVHDFRRGEFARSRSRRAFRRWGACPIA